MLVRRLELVDPGRVQRQDVAVHLDGQPHRPQEGRHGGDIAQERCVSQAEHASREESGRYQGERGVLCSADGDGAVQRLASMNHEFIHVRSVLEVTESGRQHRTTFIQPSRTIVGHMTASLQHECLEIGQEMQPVFDSRTPLPYLPAIPLIHRAVGIVHTRGASQDGLLPHRLLAPRILSQRRICIVAGNSLRPADHRLLSTLCHGGRYCLARPLGRQERKECGEPHASSTAPAPSHKPLVKFIARVVVVAIEMAR